MVALLVLGGRAGVELEGGAGGRVRLGAGRVQLLRNLVAGRLLVGRVHCGRCGHGTGYCTGVAALGCGSLGLVVQLVGLLLVELVVRVVQVVSLVVVLVLLLVSLLVLLSLVVMQLMVLLVLMMVVVVEVLLVLLVLLVQLVVVFVGGDDVGDELAGAGGGGRV